ncbi:hypothetical protein BVY03_05320 [bacterium K02(2017)]|nr:hypothetical protein BVY03_05320 [bacterium K02(2017)]
MTDNNKKQDSMLKTYARFSGFGIQLGLFFLGGVYGGKFLDAKLATKPIFLVVGGILGMLLSFYSLIKLLNQQPKKDEHESN